MISSLRIRSRSRSDPTLSDLALNWHNKTLVKIWSAFLKLCKGNLEPLFLGLAVFVYGITFSYNTGYAINPARDLGPRLFIYIAGFPRAFSRGNDIIRRVFKLIARMLNAPSSQTHYETPFKLLLVDTIIGSRFGSNYWWSNL